MNNQLALIYKHRQIILSLVDDLNTLQLCEIPTGFSNNIIWNLGHIVVTQQLLSYGLTGQPFTIPSEIIDKYRKGSKPSLTVTSDEINWIKNQFTEVLHQFDVALQAEKFTNFTPYTTSMGLKLTTIQESLQFMSYHEGIHFGIIVSLKKFITKK